MTITNWLTIVSSIVAIISVCANIVQYYQRKSQHSRLRSFAQGTFVDHFLIARACARLRKAELNAPTPENLNNMFWREIQYINGISDSSRTNIIAVSEEQLGFTPSFRHPAYPELKEVDEAVKMGVMPESLVKSSNKEIEKKI